MADPTWARSRARVIGPLATLGGVAVGDLLSHQFPLVPFAFGAYGLVYGTCVGGRLAGILSSLILTGYAGLVVARGTPIPSTELTDAIRILFVLAAMLAMTWLVASLKTQMEGAAAQAMDAQRKRRRDLEGKNRELASVNEVLSDFTYVVAHDLREPLRALSAMHGILLEEEGERLTEDGRQMLDRAQAADVRLRGLLDSLLEYARITRIDPAELRPIDVVVVLHSPECSARYERLIDARRARLESTAPGGPRVMATTEILSLVLGNLVTNAIRHNPRPDPMVRVTVELADGESMVEVAVEDNGPGFPAEVIARIAPEGAPTEPRTLRGGFGLVLVSKAIERLGGRIQIGTSPEGGGSFAFVLPLGPGPSSVSRRAE